MTEEISDQSTSLNGHMGAELKSSKYINDSEFIEVYMGKTIAYGFNNNRGFAPDYGALGQGKGKDYIDPKGNTIIINRSEGCYNCNSFMNTFVEELKITNFNRDMPGLDPGSNTIIDGKYFKRIKLDRRK